MTPTYFVYELQDMAKEAAEIARDLREFDCPERHKPKMLERLLSIYAKRRRDRWNAS